MKRVLALLAAVGLIAGAVLLRGLIDGDDNGGSGGGDSRRGDTSTADLTVVCITELAAVCQELAADDDRLAVRIEEAQTTLDALLAADFDPAGADFDAWLTVNPYPAQADEQRNRALLEPALGAPSAVIARSPLTVVGWNDRLAPLEETCAAAISWTCIGDHAAQPWSEIGGQQLWGVVRPGQANPARTATGLLTLSQATASWFGSSDFASNDFRDPAFQAWFARLERGVPEYPAPPRTPLDLMLSQGPATFDLAGSPEAIAAPAVARSRYNTSLTLLYPDPMVTADIVLVPIAGADEGDVAKLASSNDLRSALLAGGWRVPGEALPGSADPDVSLPGTDGLPTPGVVEALRNKWLEVTR